jgi:small redox-active disulfide protein 2
MAGGGDGNGDGFDLRLLFLRRYYMKKVQILGTGCPKCKKLFEAAQQVIKDNKIDAEVTKVEDINEIMKFGIMMTPALAVDGEVKVVGRVPKIEEIKAMIS